MTWWEPRLQLLVWESFPEGLAMSGPGKNLPDPAEDITHGDDLPKPKLVFDSRKQHLPE